MLIPSGLEPSTFDIAVQRYLSELFRNAFENPLVNSVLEGCLDLSALKVV